MKGCLKSSIPFFLFPLSFTNTYHLIGTCQRKVRGGVKKQKYPRGWRPLSRFNEACSCRRWNGGVSSDKVPTYSTRGPDTSRERHSRKLARPPPSPPPPPIPPTKHSTKRRISTEREHCLESIRIEPKQPPLPPKLAAFLEKIRATSCRSEGRRRYNDFQRELYVAANDIPPSNCLFCLSARRSCALIAGNS